MDEAIRFIRGTGKMQDWTDDQLALEIAKSIKRTALAYTINVEGKCNGLCFGEWLEAGKVFHVKFMAGRLSIFMSHLKEYFPQCQEITAMRGKRFQTYKLGKHL